MRIPPACSRSTPPVLSHVEVSPLALLCPKVEPHRSWDTRTAFVSIQVKGSTTRFRDQTVALLLEELIRRTERIRANGTNNVDDATLIELTKSYFEGYMQKYFRGWEDSEAYVKEIWTGSKSSSFCPT
jgi:hypothetical protein